MSTKLLSSRRCVAAAVALALLGTTGGVLAQQADARPVLRIHGPQGDSTQAVQWQPQDIVLRGAGKPGISSASLVGNAAEPGLYLVRVRMEPGTANAAHTHPDARITTIMSGTIYYGIGRVADLAHARPFGAGSVYFTPPNTPHFLITTDAAAVYEEAGVGPSRSVPVAP
ncbi:cupin domain-containing protein [Xylophilus sp. ASV27]|uniref:cupin domain-containing protein n=1 Tax=Xylophilus sp. ASV27 TaxID=2795129 RepID=UPI0018EBBBED|nr:cupin domain-containing protein [Xylophilus sp. ASV27]